MNRVDARPPLLKGDPLRSPLRTNFRVERRLPAPPQDWGKPSTSSPRTWRADPSYSRVDPGGQPGVGRGPRLLKLVPIGDPCGRPGYISPGWFKLYSFQDIFSFFLF